MKLLVCGGAGFIGSNFVRVRVRDHGDEVVVLDKLTYAGRRENLQDVEHHFIHGAIEDPHQGVGSHQCQEAPDGFRRNGVIVEIEADIDGLVRTHSFDSVGGERMQRRGQQAGLFLSEDFGDRPMVAAGPAPLVRDLIAPE